MVKESARSARDPGSIPGLGISSREGHGNPLHRVAKSQTLSNSHFFTFTVQHRAYSQYFAIKTVWYWHKNRNIVEWDRIESPVINPQIYS